MHTGGGTNEPETPAPPATPAVPATWTGEARALIKLAIPVTTAQLGMMLLGVVDVLMVGHLSEQALAAVSLGHAYTFSLMILGMGALFVLDPLVSQAWGARQLDAVATFLHRGAVLAIVLAIPFGAAFYLGRPLLAWITDQPAVVDDAYAYARVSAYGLPAFFLFIVVRQGLQAMHIVRPVIVAVLLANVANVVLNRAFVYGDFGAPALGVVGSAWATAICRWFMAALLIAIAVPWLRPVWRRPTRAVFHLRSYGTMLWRGGQIGLQMALEVWVFLAVSFLMVSIGTLEMAGHTVALNLASVSFMVPLGIGAAAAVRVGNAIGRGDPEAARLAARVALALGASVMLVSAAAMILAPVPLAKLYSSENDVIALAAVLLPIAGVFQVFDGTQAVGCGILRGAGDTAAAALINLCGYWLLGFPLAVGLAFGADLGPRGAWWGLTAGLAACAVLLVVRVVKKIGRDDLRPLAG